ncbi:MAG: prephenate dehydrogenase/arogenate dehydrogenase family protein [Clostridiaceae bacterium]
MKVTRITIIGLGLMGGSLAKALHEKLGLGGIIAVDNDADALSLALKEGIIAKGLNSPDSDVYDSDIIFICTPVKQALSYMDVLAPHIRDTCIITDVCSTKEEIARHVEKMPKPPCYIGGHPMTGTEKSGYSNSFAHLFENAYYVLSPGFTASARAQETVKGIVEGIGAIPVFMDAGEHDRVTGGISHLPHIIAAALVNLVNEQDNGSGKMKALAAGGFKDITRIASSSPEMWENIVLSNKGQVIELLKLFGKTLEEFLKILKNDDSAAIYRFFSGAKIFRDSISAQATGLLQPLYRLIVDVKDEPGIIGEIATILGNNNINIKNINVTNSREFEQGCLIIALPDTDSVNIAFDLLVNTGYKVYKNK